MLILLFNKGALAVVDVVKFLLGDIYGTFMGCYKMLHDIVVNNLKMTQKRVKWAQTYREFVPTVPKQTPRPR